MKNEGKNVNVEDAVQKDKHLHTNLAGISLFIFLLDKLSDAIYNMFVNGLFGRIFSSYFTGLSSYENGQFVAYFKGTKKSRLFFRRIRMFLGMLGVIGLLTACSSAVKDGEAVEQNQIIESIENAAVEQKENEKYNVNNNGKNIAKNIAKSLQMH